MGYAVLHMEKTGGTDAAMSAHIERTIHPKNADASRTHLNRELIKFPDGVENRTQAIQHRLDTAGLTRKIGNNQVRAIRVLLTGTHEDMERITQEGRLDKWCEDNLRYLSDTFGRENIVSAVLHMDEQTPHIHATLVPIVREERKRKKKEQQVKKRYRKKPTDAARLCADDIMTRAKLKSYQDSYAQAKIQTMQTEHKKELSRLTALLNKTLKWFPQIKGILNLERGCLAGGFSQEQTAVLMMGKPLEYSGELYSEEYKRKFMAKDVKAKVFTDKGKFVLTIDLKPIGDWFREQFGKLKQGFNVRQNPKQSRLKL